MISQDTKRRIALTVATSKAIQEAVSAEVADECGFTTERERVLEKRTDWAVQVYCAMLLAESPR
jgi:hypothetical protein